MNRGWSIQVSWTDDRQIRPGRSSPYNGYHTRKTRLNRSITRVISPSEPSPSRPPRRPRLSLHRVRTGNGETSTSSSRVSLRTSWPGGGGPSWRTCSKRMATFPDKHQVPTPTIPHRPTISSPLPVLAKSSTPPCPQPRPHPMGTSRNLSGSTIPPVCISRNPSLIHPRTRRRRTTTRI